MLNPEPDGLGYFYGQLHLGSGEVLRVDILPPARQWRGDVRHDRIDADDWIVFVDGEEIARVRRRSDIEAAIIGRLLPSP